MFILFGFDYYYPSGGWDDMLGTFTSLEEAQDAVAVDRTRFGGQGRDQYQIVQVDGNGYVDEWSL
jgi:hypothetical protein